MANELEQARELIDRAVSGMTEEQLLFHPGEKWCSANILEHLALAFSGTVKGMQRVVEAGKPLGGRRSLRDIALQTGLLTLGYFPTGRTAPKMVTPSCTLGGLEALAMIRENLQSMAAKLDEVEKQFGTSRRILDHPILGPLTLPQWRKFHLVHARHHMKQIDQLRGAQSERSAVGAVASR